MINGEAFSIPVSVSFVGHCIQHVTLFNEDTELLSQFRSCSRCERSFKTSCA